MRQLVLAFLVSIFGWFANLQGQEPTARNRIISVGVFRNGFTIVKSEVTVPGAGTFHLENAPEPVHGTLWIESNCKVEVAVRMREVEVPTTVGGRGNLQEELAGKMVTIRFKDGKSAPITGTVARIARPETSFLIVKTPKGHAYVNSAEIASLDAGGMEEAVKQRKPVLVLTVDKTEQKPVIFVTYLTRGLAWAPSYLVDITDPQQFSMEMAAVLKNELARLDDADVKLISGSSSVQFAQVPSPLAPNVSLDKFLAALSATVASEREAVDLYFQSVGKRSLSEREALRLILGKAKVDYERIVEWNVTPQGRARRGGGQNDDIWDVLHFKNPFTFPMAAAPVMVTVKGQFNGQRSCEWANVGDETSLRISRSLSVRAFAQEREEQPKKDALGKDKFETVKIAGVEYQLVTMQGELIINNQRKQATKMRVRRTISGRILSAEGKPEEVPLPEGLSAINASQDLVWTINLEPGEQKTLRYRYNFIPGGGVHRAD